jgi:hypothetical protein
MHLRGAYGWAMYQAIQLARLKSEHRKNSVINVLQSAKPLQNFFREDSANFYKNIFKSSWPHAGPFGELQY